MAHSADTVLKAASITSELYSSTRGSNTKAKPCHETQTPVSVSLPILLHIYFHDSLHFQGWFEMLPSLSTIYLACHLATAHTMGIRLLSSLPWILLLSSFAQISLQSKFQEDLLHCVLQELERIPFPGESNVQHLQWAHEGFQVPQHKSLLLAQLLLWAEVLFLCHIITTKKDT